MEIEQKLREIGVKPGRGQNFLNSETAAQALVEAAEIEEDSKVLEIGPGLGIITGEITKKTDNLTAVEKNRNLASHIQENYPEIDVIRKDFLEMDLKERVFDRVVSNIPFQVSSEIIEKLGEDQLQSALIIQEELADKIVAEPGEKNYGIATVKAQYYFLPVKLRVLDSANFYPEPEVNAAIVKLYPNRTRHPVEDEKEFFQLAKALFTHKRKKVRNAFVDARHILGYEKEKAKEIRDSLPSSEERVNNLEITEIAEISKALRREN